MGLQEDKNDYSLRDFPKDPIDGQEFIIKDENEEIVTYAIYNAKQGKWINRL